MYVDGSTRTSKTNLGNLHPMYGTPRVGKPGKTGGPKSKGGKTDLKNLSPAYGTPRVGKPGKVGGPKPKSGKTDLKHLNPAYGTPRVGKAGEKRKRPQPRSLTKDVGGDRGAYGDYGRKHLDPRNGPAQNPNASKGNIRKGTKEFEEKKKGMKGLKDAAARRTYRENNKMHKGRYYGPDAFRGDRDVYAAWAKAGKPGKGNADWNKFKDNWRKKNNRTD